MFYTIVTNSGLEKITAAANSSSKIELTKIAVGSGDLIPNEETTELVEKVAEFNIDHVDIDNEYSNRVVVYAKVPENLGGFTVKEIGILDSDGVLFAAGRVPETYIPDIESAAKEVLFQVYIEIASSSAIEIDINESLIFVTREELKELQKISNLDGKSSIYKGTTEIYTLTDYDSFSTYSVSATIGTAVLEKDKLHLTIDAATQEEETEITINKDGITHKYRVTLLEPAILTPAVVSPSDGAIDILEAPTIRASEFATAPLNFDTQESRSYQIATDAEFTNIVVENIDDPVNKQEWVVPIGFLQENTTYYARVRDRGVNLGYSDWSDGISFTTTAHFFIQEAMLLEKSNRYVRFNDIKQYNNGYVVVGDTLESEDLHYRGVGGNTGIILILDRQFNIINAKELKFTDSSTNSFIFSAVDIDANGDIYAGGVAYFPNNSNPTKMLSSIFVFDENLNILKESHWDNTHWSNNGAVCDGFITDIKVTNEQVIFTSAEYGNGSSYGWLTVINKSNHTRVFSKTHEYMGHGFCVDMNGNIYSVGQYYTGGHYYDRLVKIDSSGNVTDCKTLSMERSWGSSVKFKDGFLWYVTQGRFLSLAKIDLSNWSVSGKQILYAGDTYYRRRSDIDIDTNGDIYLGGGASYGTVNFVKINSGFEYVYHKKVKNYDTYAYSAGINRAMCINNRVLFLGEERVTDSASHKSKGLLLKIEDNVLSNCILPNFTEFEVIDFSVSNSAITSIGNADASGIEDYDRNSIGLPENYIFENFTFDNIYREEF